LSNMRAGGSIELELDYGRDYSAVDGRH
jgi:hypothetical protein